MNARRKQLDFLIISTGRAASTAIYKYISELACFHLPWNKEPHYWCDIDKYEGIYPLLREINISNEADYWSLYSKSNCVTDASVGYFFYLEEVINNLAQSNQMPKVIFLYREPISRAGSFFNELKKKNITHNGCIEEDIVIHKRAGLWWEYYYDNVEYYNGFLEMQSYFHEILAINYDYFAQNQFLVLQRIMDFINKGGVDLDGIYLPPVNTSQEAIMHIKTGAIKNLRFLFPKRLNIIIKSAMKHVIRSRQDKTNKNYNIDIRLYLKNSLSQYERFRQYINMEDVLWLKK
jgi:hypothetical protein